MGVEGREGVDGAEVVAEDSRVRVKNPREWAGVIAWLHSTSKWRERRMIAKRL